MFDLSNYAGDGLTLKNQRLIEQIGRLKLPIQMVVTGRSSKTIRLRHQPTGIALGFIAQPIMRRDVAYGYHFRPLDRRADGCPQRLERQFLDNFCRRYGCKPNEVDTRDKWKKPERLSYFSPREVELAIRVLKLDCESLR